MLTAIVSAVYTDNFYKREVYLAISSNIKHEDSYNNRGNDFSVNRVMYMCSRTGML
jgi:hypothetical protein